MSKILQRFTLIIIVIIAFSACAKKPLPEVSFYYWRTVFSLSESERNILKDTDSAKVYLRYFDLILPKGSAEAIPESPITFKDSPNSFKIIPVIYIKNEVMVNDKEDLEKLADKMLDYISQINKKNNIETSEVQIDCDWTLASKDNFMMFMEILKSKTTDTLSATIRLHQIKYSKTTGIPAVDYGVLMYYNMGKIAADNSNSIYDRKIAEQYLSKLAEYPLLLKVALPIFSWAVQIRTNKVVGLSAKITQDDVISNDFEKVSENIFRIKRSHYLKGSLLNKNDLLKIEKVSSKELSDMASDLKKNLKQSSSEIIFFDLNENNIKQYEKSIYKEISSSF